MRRLDINLQQNKDIFQLMDVLVPFAINIPFLLIVVNICGGKRFICCIIIIIANSTVSYFSVGHVFEIFVSFQGYALLCVGFPSSDLEVETQDEDEVTSKIAIITCASWLLFNFDLVSNSICKISHNIFVVPLNIPEYFTLSLGHVLESISHLIDEATLGVISLFQLCFLV